MSSDFDEYGGTDDHGGISLRNLRTFESLKNPVFRLFFGGMFGQWAGLNMQMTARSLLIYRLTDSAAILGAMSFAQAIPMLCFSLFGGIIADRVQKKYVLLAGQASSAVVSLGVALSLTSGYLSLENEGSWWILIVASVLQGTILALMMPARQAILPEIVGEEQLMNAISLSTMGMNILRLLAPAIGGFLIDAAGFEAVYYTTSGLYLLSVIFISFLPLTGTTTFRGGRALAKVKEGLSYIRKETSILLVLVFSLTMVVLSAPYMIMMPIFADDVLDVGASGLGVLMSLSGAGSLAGSLILASLPNKKRGFMLFASGTLTGLALVAFSSSNSWPLSLALIVFVGLGQTGQMTLGNTLLQYYVEDEYRGRVMSIFMMQMGLMSLGAFAMGLLAEVTGVQLALGGFAAVLVCLSIIAMVSVPRVRKLE